MFLKNKIFTRNNFTNLSYLTQNVNKCGNILQFQFFMKPGNVKFFTGKTETGHKFTTPKLLMKSVKPILPPPGENLEIPKWTPKYFCERIGGDCHEAADKFEDIKEIFTMKSDEMKAKGIAVKQRKYLLRTVDLMRRGLLTFEYLQRRTSLKPCRKLTISQAGSKGKKEEKKGEKKEK